MYTQLKEDLEEILEYWGNDVTDEDVSDLPKYCLKCVVEKSTSFLLYRYMPPDYFNIRNIETQTIHLSPNGVMNDVFEGLPESFEDLSFSHLQKLKDLAYMTCMTENNNNLLMWSHYARNHEGFCVEYDLKRLKEDPFNVLHHIFPIIYRDQRQSNRDLVSLAESHSILSEAILKQFEYDGCETLDNILPLFLTKSKAWAYENEWRVVYTKKQMYDINEDELYQCNLKFKCLSAVYLGYRIHPEKKKNILEICERISTEKDKIRVYQANLAPKSYGIVFNQIL